MFWRAGGFSFRLRIPTSWKSKQKFSFFYWNFLGFQMAIKNLGLDPDSICVPIRSVLWIRIRPIRIVINARHLKKLINYVYFFPQNFNLLSKILKIMTSLTLMTDQNCRWVMWLKVLKKSDFTNTYETWDRIRMRFGIIMMPIRIRSRICINIEIRIRIRITGLIYEKVKFTCTSSLCW